MPASRRAFLAALCPALLGAAGSARPLRITGVDTVYWQSRDAAPFWPHWTWLRLRTDAGLEGVGETYPRSAGEAALIHSAVAPALAGRDARDIERIWSDLYRTFDYQITGGAEMRALSAVDLALWDLLAKSLEAPVYRLLGGVANPAVRLYNTCFPLRYDFHTDPDKIMREVLDRHGVSAIKIWPFDRAALRNRHQFITAAEIDEALRPVKKLRDAFGDAIEILIEFHSNWDLPSAARIARALEPFRPMWLEDMLLPAQFAQYRRLADATPLPLTVGERMAGRYAFADLMASGAARYIMLDLCWCGGLSEARKVAAMAAAHHLPIAPHTAGGPLLFYATTHLTTATANVAIQESCQRFYEQDWPLMLEQPLKPEKGTIRAPEAPGFGMRIKPEVWNHPAAVRQSTYV